MTIFGEGVSTDDLLVKPVFRLMICVVKPVFRLMEGGVWTELFNLESLASQCFREALKCSNKCY